MLNYSVDLDLVEARGSITEEYEVTKLDFIEMFQINTKSEA